MIATLKYDELIGFSVAFGTIVVREDLNLRKEMVIELAKMYAKFKGVELTGLDDKSIENPYVNNYRRRIKINKYNSDKRGTAEKKEKGPRTRGKVFYRPADLEIAKFRADELRIVEFRRSKDQRTRRGVITYAAWDNARQKVLYYIRTRNDNGKEVEVRLAVDHLSLKFIE